MDISKILAVFLDKLKILIWPIIIFCIVLLFSPDNWIGYFNLKDVIAEYKTWISLVFLVCSSFAVVEIATGIKKIITKWTLSKGKKSNIKKHLNSLSDTQRYIVHFMSHSSTPSGMYLNMSHPEVSDLSTKGIIFRTSSIGQLTSFAYSLKPEVKEVIEKDSNVQNIISVYNDENVLTSAVGSVREW